jgi:glycine cleavage system aminomethyltransferase T
MSTDFAHLPFTVIGPRLRQSPFFAATRKYGCKAYSVYNHMYMPLFYEDPVSEYWNLLNHVCLWDVACERQVEISGPDAFKLSQYLTCRDVSKCEVGQCMYAPLLDERGNILNDPIMLRVEENKFWFSLADSDILLWVKGIALGNNYDVIVNEPFVSPLAVQGPKAEDLMTDLLGKWVRELKFFRCQQTTLNSIPFILARSGWSKQGGFELYLQDSRYGEELWNSIMLAGKPYNIAPGAPSNIERIESGLLSFGSDMDFTNNPFEVGLDKFINLEQEHDFIGKEALIEIKETGLKQKLCGLEFFEQSVSSNENRWPVLKGDKQFGTVRSACYSPRLKKNLAFAMLSIQCSEPGTQVSVQTPEILVEAKVCDLPFTN